MKLMLWKGRKDREIAQLKAEVNQLSISLKGVTETNDILVQALEKEGIIPPSKPDMRIKLLLTDENVINFMQDYNKKNKTELTPYSAIYQFFGQHSTDDVIDKLTEMLSQGLINEKEVNLFEIMPERVARGAR